MGISFLDPFGGLGRLEGKTTELHDVSLKKVDPGAFLGKSYFWA